MKSKDTGTVLKTFDCKLSSVIVDGTLLPSITGMVHKITEILHVTSLASNYVVIHLLDNGKKLLPLDRTFFFAIIYAITTSKSNRPINEKMQTVMDHIKTAINDFKTKTSPPNINRDACSDILEVIIHDNFIPNATLNVSENFFEVQKSFIFVHLFKLVRENENINSRSILSLAQHVCSSINDPNKLFSFKKTGLVFSNNSPDDKWSVLRKTMFSLPDETKTILIEKINELITDNRACVVNIMEEMITLNETYYQKKIAGEACKPEAERTEIDEPKIVLKLTKGDIKTHPHLLLKYIYDINKFYNVNRPSINSCVRSNTASEQFRYTANKSDYNTKEKRYIKNKKPRKKKRSPEDVEIDRIMKDLDLEDENDFDILRKCKKHMKSKCLLPIRSGLPCFITLSRGHRLENFVRYHFNQNPRKKSESGLKVKVRSIYVATDETEKGVLAKIIEIYGAAKNMLENGYGKIKQLAQLIRDLRTHMLDIMDEPTMTQKLIDLKTYLSKNVKLDNIKMVETANSIGSFMDYLIKHWLFVENKVDKKTLDKLAKDKFFKNDWWRILFRLEDQFKHFRMQYMFTKKFYHRSINVYNVLGNYITTDGYQVKLLLKKSKAAEAPNVSNLYEKNYAGIKVEGEEDEYKVTELLDRGIYDVNDLEIDPSVLVGRVAKGVDPGIASVLTWTEVKIKDDSSIDVSDAKGTDKEVTNGEYQSSWFKGPFRVIEDQWREKHEVKEIINELGKYNTNNCELDSLSGYLKVLFEAVNYKKIKNYKYEPQRLKWKYKRLLGKRSYIDKITNSLAYGKVHKKYDRERKTYQIDRKKPAIIFFGGGCFKTAMKNYSAVPRKTIVRVLGQKTLVLITGEHCTTKKCFKCGHDLQEIKDKREKQVGGRIHKKWSSSDLRNVRYCENKCCVKDGYDKFFVNRDVNASINILSNGLETLNITVGGKQPQTEHVANS